MFFTISLVARLIEQQLLLKIRYVSRKHDKESDNATVYTDSSKQSDFV